MPPDLEYEPPDLETPEAVSDQLSHEPASDGTAFEEPSAKAEAGEPGLGDRLLRRSRRVVRRLEASDPRLRLALALLAVVAVSLVAGLVAGTCFGGDPTDPIEALGLGDAGAPPPGGEQTIDPEQEVFAERRQRQLAERQRLEEAAGVPDFTDHALASELSGLWNLDLGSGRRGFRVRFGAEPVRTVHRERFDVTLFSAQGRGLPPYYTILDLPEGKLMAFLDAAGTFRLVLEDLRRESDGRLSWRGSGFDRRYARRLDGPSPWRFGDDETGPFGRRDDDGPLVRPAEPADPLGRTQPPRVGTRPRPQPSVSSRQALTEVERHLDELAFGLMERDPGRVFALWGGRPDDVTREAVSGLLGRYRALRAWARVLTIEVVVTDQGTEVRFEAVVTVQGAPKGARNRQDVDLRDIRWRGRIRFPDEPEPGQRGGVRRGVQLDPFPG